MPRVFTRTRIGLIGWGVAIFVVAWLSGRRVAQGPGAVVRVYDVRDLLTQPPNFVNAPSLGIVPRKAPTVPPPVATTWMSTSVASLATTNHARADEVASMIRASVEPQSWGERDRAIVDFAGQLAVTQTPAVHAQIERFLYDLRRARNLQVTLECRFLAFDDASLARLPKELRKRIAPGPDAEGLASPLALSGPESNMLLNALQAGTRLTTVTAPRMTLANGQRAYVTVATQRAYVANLVRTTGMDGTVVVTPDVDVVSSGMVVDVQASASADHKSVTLALRPEFSELIAMDPPGLPGGTLAQSVQRPTVDFRTLSTTVTVPVGRTYVLSGFTRRGPERLVAWATTGPSTRPAGNPRPQNLYLLFKPTIIEPAIDPGAGVFLK